MSLHLLKVSVRDLVGFVLRSGDLVGGGFASARRLAEGTRVHQRVQQARPEGYRSEVALSHLVEAGGLTLEISGRLDGLLVEDELVVVEEIKTVQEEIDAERPENPVHWAQAKVYAAILALQHDLERVGVQLTYVQLDTYERLEERRVFSRQELVSFFNDLVARYLHWARRYGEWGEKRDQSIAELEFPFPAYRPGQRRLAGAAYRAIQGQGRLFAQAPTGIGKTISTLFPALKALGLGHVEKVFYLTARTSGRGAAEKALDDMRSAGLRLKSLTLTARDRICFKPMGGARCVPEQCEYAIGYYDRINDALQEVFDHDALTRQRLEEYAQKHRVCPFEFSLELSLWSDVIVCDYNYVFDPRAYLRRFFLDNAGAYAFLIDEAHNLVDRGREMFSAELYKSQVLDLKRAVARDHPELGKRLEALNRYFLKVSKKIDKQGDGQAWVDPALPADLMLLLERFLGEAEKVLSRNVPWPYWDELIDFYFEALAFQRVGELFDEHYTTCAQKQDKEVHLRLFCMDPSQNIRQALKRGIAAVFFSATLTPLEYFRDLLGGEEGDSLLSLDSPFPPQNLHLLLADHVETTYKKRQETYDGVTESIAVAVSQRPGKYLAFFPSYRYLEEVASRFAASHPDLEMLVQTPNMPEKERQAFLAAFDADNSRTALGFAVLGGLFGESIDLVGERLVGAIVVGVGLPQLCLERDLIRHYFDSRAIPGFEYAYTYPGMNRVLQAAGRVIRTAEDRGMVLLIDRRFGQSRYRQLFPPSWRPVRVRSPEQIGRSLEWFWGAGQST
jgi:DNA excision repair protein ERCC-2